MFTSNLTIVDLGKRSVFNSEKRIKAQKVMFILNKLLPIPNTKKVWTKTQ